VTEDLAASYVEERQADAVRGRVLKMDGELEDSKVEFVEADMVEEKDNEAGLFIGEANTVEARESR